MSKFYDRMRHNVKDFAVDGKDFIFTRLGESHVVAYLPDGTVEAYHLLIGFGPCLEIRAVFEVNNGYSFKRFEVTFANAQQLSAHVRILSDSPSEQELTRHGYNLQAEGVL